MGGKPAAVLPFWSMQGPRLSCLAMGRGEIAGECLRALERQPDRKKRERTGRRKGGGRGKRKGKDCPVGQAECEGGSAPGLRRLTGGLRCSDWEHRPRNEQDEGELSPSGFQSPASLLGTLK